MKKLASLFILATLTCAGISHAQTPKPSNDTDSPFGGPLSHNRPAPKPTAAPAGAEGKKMVGEANVATDEKGKNDTADFPSGTAIVYLETKNVSGAKGDKVRADWIADDAGKALPKGKRFYNSAIDLPDTQSYNPSFHVTGPGNKALPAGKYHVDLFVGSEKLKTVKFAVQ